MREIDVTDMVTDSDEMPNLSGSQAELGCNAGQLTWRNSVAYATKRPILDSPELLKEARDHFAAYGAWERDEIDAWSDDELQGATVQDVAAAIREMEHYDSVEDFRAASEQGSTSGRLYEGDNGRWYFMLCG